MEISQFLMSIVLPILDNHFILINFFGSLIIGNVFILAVSMMAGHGRYNFWLILPIFFIANITSDLIWFYLARHHLVDKIIKMKFNKIAKKLRNVKNHPLMRSDFLIMLFSSFLYGTEKAAIFYFSRKKISYLEFIKIDLIPTFLWIFSITGVGFLVGKGFTKAKEIFDSVRLIITLFLALILVVYLIWIFISKWVIKEEIKH